MSPRARSATIGQQSSFLIPVALLVLFPSLLLAQSDTATISGRITDESSALLVGAQVHAINLQTGIKTSTVTNDGGIYVLDDLRPGEYRVVVDAKGFREVVLTGLILSVQDAIDRNFTMQVGSVNQSITITASSEEVDASPSVSTLVNPEFVQNMPLNGRSFQSLLGLTPGFVLVSPLYTQGGIAPGQFSFSGQRSNANYFMVDGVSANFAVNSGFSLGQTAGGTIPAFTIQGGTNGLVSVDDMQEFRVQTSTFAPEYGNSPGSQISIVTRSGSNQLHGLVFDYLRNDIFDARNYFDVPPLPKPPLRQNDFGGTIGGPIVRDRAFFFFSYEGLRLLQPQTASGTFYTAAARANVAPVYQPLLAALPLPNGPVNPNGLTAPLTVAYSNPTSFNVYSLRVDYTPTDRVTLFARYNYAPSIESAYYFSDLQSETANVNTATVGAAIAFGSNKVNDFRANWSQLNGGSSAVMTNFHGAVPPPPSSMFPPGYSSITNQFVFVAPHFNEVQSGRTSDNTQRQVEFADTFSMSEGTHQLKFGADFRRLTPTSGTYGYSALVFGNSYSDLQAGIASSVVTSSGATITARIYNYSLFAQDVWRASSRLTLTYGLRWEIDTPPVSITPGKPLYAVTGIFDSQPFGFAPAGTPLWHTEFTNFAPRFGAAYQVTPQTVVRGGFGVFYDANYGGGALFTMTSFPYQNSSSGGPVPFDFSNPAFAPPPFTLVPNASIGNMYAVDPNLRLPIVYEWNAAVERWLGPNQSVSLTYLGSYGQNLLREDAIIENVQGGPIDVFSTRNADWSHYNAFEAQYQRRLSHGLQALISYTLAKSTDTSSNDVCVPCTSANSLKDINVGADLGPSDFDVRNSFAAAVTYQFPSPKWGKVGSALLRDWAVDGIVQVSSAPPLNLVLAPLTPGFGVYTPRPDIVPGVPFYVSDPSQPNGQRLNSAAFTTPTNGGQGDLPRNYFRAYGIDQTDLALTRQFSLTERLSLFFRVEYFNLFNHPMFAPPNNFVGSSGFGTVYDTLNDYLSGLSPLYQVGGPRSGQFTIKMLF